MRCADQAPRSAACPLAFSHLGCRPVGHRVLALRVRVRLEAEQLDGGVAGARQVRRHVRFDQGLNLKGGLGCGEFRKKRQRLVKHSTAKIEPGRRMNAVLGATPGARVHQGRPKRSPAQHLHACCCEIRAQTRQQKLQAPKLWCRALKT